MRKLEKNRSAQVFILAALAIATIILSTEVYVFQLSQYSTIENTPSQNEFARIVKSSSRNLIVAILANISKGESNPTMYATTLNSILQRWTYFVTRNYYLGECALRSDLYDGGLYSSGLRIDWAQNGSGVTSVKANFQMNLTSESASMNTDYSINITTYLHIYCTANSLDITRKQITVKIELYNEEVSALAENLTLYYRVHDIWIKTGLTDGLHLEDFGNGTYRASFVESSDPSEISVQCYDTRGIFVQANATFT